MRARWLAALLAPRLIAWARTRPHPKGAGHPDFQVAPNGEVYLNRWHVIKPKWWHPGLYLHEMIRDDDDVKHDHPYASLSLCLAEGLEEHYRSDPATVHDLDVMLGDGEYRQHMHCQVREVRPGDIILRSSTMAHQLKVRPGSNPWTLFATGRRLKKEWGFWCPRGHRHFKKYANVGGGVSGIGNGCGEQG